MYSVYINSNAVFSFPKKKNSSFSTGEEMAKTEINILASAVEGCGERRSWIVRGMVTRKKVMVALESPRNRMALGNVDSLVFLFKL